MGNSLLNDSLPPGPGVLRWVLQTLANDNESPDGEYEEEVSDEHFCRAVKIISTTWLY